MAVLGLPLYLPKDSAIPVPKVAAKNHATVRFVRDHSLLQREQKKGVPGFLTLLAYIFVFLIWAGMVAVVAWGLARLASALGSSPPSEPPAERRRHPIETPSGVQPTTA